MISLRVEVKSASGYLSHTHIHTAGTGFDMYDRVKGRKNNLAR